MPGGSTLARGNIILEQVIQQSMAPPASIAANSTVTQTYNIPGLVVGDFVELNQQSHVAGISVGNVWVNAAGTLTMQWVNSTTSASSASPTAQLFVLTITRAENISLSGIAGLPTGIY